MSSSGPIDTDWLPTAGDIELSKELSPSEGILSSFTNIIVAGLGSVLVTLFVAIASIPTGFYIAFRELVDGGRTFLIAFVEAFFQPFYAGADCVVGSGLQSCSYNLAGVESTNAVLASAGIAGFALSVVVIGAMAYIATKGVGQYVG